MSTGIEWTDETWNPIVGCSVISPGCTNCYAMRQAGFRLDGNPRTPHYAGTTRRVKGQSVWTGKVALAPEKAFMAPYHKRWPTMYFVNSMGDLFHEGVPDEWIDKVYAVAVLSPLHIFQILTKRSARMKAYWADLAARWRAIAAQVKAIQPINAPDVSGNTTPPANVWHGVSAEDQPRADERIPDLLATPSAKRFLSAEPLLGRIDLRRITIRPRLWVDALTGFHGREFPSMTVDAGLAAFAANPLPKQTACLDQVIAGGESGMGARPMHIAWARTLRDQCAQTFTAFFFKQHGEWIAADQAGAAGMKRWDHRFLQMPDDSPPLAIYHVGKRAAGALLDGVEHKAIPR